MSSSVPGSPGKRLREDGSTDLVGVNSSTTSTEDWLLIPGGSNPSKRHRGSPPTRVHRCIAPTQTSKRAVTSSHSPIYLASSYSPASINNGVVEDPNRTSSGATRRVLRSKFVLNGWRPPSMLNSKDDLLPPPFDFFNPAYGARDFGQVTSLDPSYHKPVCTLSPGNHPSGSLSSIPTLPRHSSSNAQNNSAGEGVLSPAPFLGMDSHTGEPHCDTDHLLSFSHEDRWPDSLDTLNGAPHHPRLYLGQDSGGNFDFAIYSAPPTVQGSTASQVVLAIHRKATDDGDYRLEALPIFPRDNHTEQLDSRQSLQDRNQKSFVIAMWMEKERLRRQKGSSQSVSGASKNQSKYSDPFAPISDRRLHMTWSNQFNEPRSIAFDLKIMESKVPIDELRGGQIEDLADGRFEFTSHSFDMGRDHWPVYAQQSFVSTGPSITISSPKQ